MDIFRPRSFFSLVLIGFSLVVIPLTVGLINAARSVNNLTEKSRAVVYNAVNATQKARLAAQQIVAMERAVRQFAVLGDEALFENYQTVHRHFRENAAVLAQLPLDEANREILTSLVAREQELHDRLIAARPRGTGWEGLNEFELLLRLARTLLDETDRLIERELTTLQETAGGTELLLKGQAFALVPVALALITIFAILISRPVKQMDRSIRRLGAGEFHAPIAIRGPRDLEQLGARLEWLRHRLAELDEEKQRFLRHVSHELKTPLSAIREGSELLGEGVLGTLNDEQREVAQILQTNSAYLQRLIEDLLSLNLAGVRLGTTRRERVRFDELVQAVADRYRLALRKKNIALRLHLIPATVRGDPEKLGTVVDNLLSNAIKYAPEKSEITVDIRVADGFASLDIADQGPGIAEQDRPRVFDAFFQGKRTATMGQVKGTGLGLAIAKEHVAAHDGHIELLDAEHGAHFRVYLPLLQEGARYAS